ncbi:hypothetical protein Q4603_20075 [Zobellia galactanivorans]|uniref:hypothetical protein n=1 Tax=Zobellia galactanivorans (strain DSM 12802 / CCUG 47099 / CIP 106680 / NCIMB 13871 / Dsij) TaxID=63186 RepID=UPI001C073B84|nr:hypothetical protein [Zobellia galactanivorans]MBU3025203.1 hypothetical protein [Zobellia galactanivorans]MDO6810930.1 hypothetical protein [Zobellia galactanivorans]
MSTGVNKEQLKASESAPMPTKQVDDGSVNNQTTNVPKNRFPWVTIIMIFAFVVFLAIVFFVLNAGS